MGVFPVEFETNERLDNGETAADFEADVVQRIGKLLVLRWGDDIRQSLAISLLNSMKKKTKNHFFFQHMIGCRILLLEMFGL